MVVVGIADRLGPQQRGLRLQRVVVGQRIFGRLHRARRREIGDRDFQCRAGVRRLRPVRQFLIPPGGGVRAQRIRQHHGVHAVGVLEEVIDAFLLHQATDEVEVILAILHAVFARRIVSAEAQLDVAIADFGQHGLDDVRHRHLEVDAAIHLVQQQPRLGHQRHRVLGVALFLVALEPGLGNFRDHAVEVALVAVRFERHRHRAAEQRKKLDFAVLAEQLQLVGKKLPELLAARQARRQQFVTEV